MGGINIHEESVYPHFSRKYREGGFHYRYGSQVGMYEGVLRCLLAAAEGSRVRVPVSYTHARAAASPSPAAGRSRRWGCPRCG